MITRATAAQLDQILRIERSAFTAPHWPWDAYEQMLSDTENIRRVLLVDVEVDLEGDHVTGFAGGSLVAGEAQLESIAVAASARRQGIGRALCQAFLAWAQSEAATSVSLEVRAGSDRVQALYAGLGFVAVGRRQRYYSNPVEDGVLMQCLLPPPACDGP